MARRTAAMAGVPFMIHITDSPIPLPEILAEMAPGDIVTHCYHGRANGIMGPEKQLVLKEVVEAQRHGIIFDCAHGRNHFSFPMIEKALDQGFLPDTISTDLTVTSATRGPVFDLPTTMTKLLHFGMPLADLVARAGTTGDYPPFSRKLPRGGYEGADIEMTHDLAERLGVRVEFVPAVWVELLDDFLADKFDIAMGGVTVTAARAEKAFFSVPIFVDGKRPLARREYADRFTSVEAIDRSEERRVGKEGRARWSTGE